MANKAISSLDAICEQLQDLSKQADHLELPRVAAEMDALLVRVRDKKAWYEAQEPPAPEK